MLIPCIFRTKITAAKSCWEYAVLIFLSFTNIPIHFNTYAKIKSIYSPYPLVSFIFVFSAQSSAIKSLAISWMQYIYIQSSHLYFYNIFSNKSNFSTTPPLSIEYLFSESWKGGWEEVDEGKVGINGDGMRFDLGWQTHNIILVYRSCTIELYTWNLYNFIN